MNDYSIVSYLLVGFGCYLIGKWVGRTSTIIQITKNLIENRHDIERVLKKYQKEIELSDSNSTVSEKNAEELKVEKHGDQLFLYTKDNDEFISQGADLKEALERAEKRFPDRSFRGHISKQQAEELGISVSKP